MGVARLATALWIASAWAITFPTMAQPPDPVKKPKEILLAYNIAPNQKLPDTLKTRPPNVVDIKQEIPTIIWDPIYCKKDKNPTGEPLYPTGARPWGCKKMVEALKRASGLLEAKGFGFILHDAYRPHHVTIKLWNAARAKNLGDNTYACPWKTSSHNRAAAVDVSIYSLSTKYPQEMPSEVDGLPKETVSPEALKNQMILKEAMLQAGFLPHRSEWWHFEFQESTKNPPGDWKP